MKGHFQCFVSSLDCYLVTDSAIGCSAKVTNELVTNGKVVCYSFFSTAAASHLTMSLTEQEEGGEGEKKKKEEEETDA